MWKLPTAGLKDVAASPVAAARTRCAVTEATLKEPRTLAGEGVVTMLAIVDADNGKLADPPAFLVRGTSRPPSTPSVQMIEKTLAHAAYAAG